MLFWPKIFTAVVLAREASVHNCCEGDRKLVGSYLKGKCFEGTPEKEGAVTQFTLGMP